MAMFYPENWALIKDFDGQPTPAPSNIAARTAQAQGFLDVVSLPALFMHLQVASNSDDDAAERQRRVNRVCRVVDRLLESPLGDALVASAEVQSCLQGGLAHKEESVRLLTARQLRAN